MPLFTGAIVLTGPERRLPGASGEEAYCDIDWRLGSVHSSLSATPALCRLWLSGQPDKAYKGVGWPASRCAPAARALDHRSSVDLHLLRLEPNREDGRRRHRDAGA